LEVIIITIAIVGKVCQPGNLITLSDQIEEEEKKNKKKRIFIQTCFLKHFKDCFVSNATHI
jgi:hypothetical protein